MHVLLGIAVGVVLLYFWLLAHWFARVLMVILLVPLFAIAVAGVFYRMDPTAALAPETLGVVIGAVAAWYAAGIPTYYWRWRLRIMVGASD